MADWSPFFAAAASAAATLAGLVFVAVSINLTRVLEHPLLPLRALEGLFALVSVLFVALLGLVPEQSAIAVGSEIAIVGALTWAFQAWALASTYSEGRSLPRFWVRVMCCLLPAPPYVVGGLLIAIGSKSAGGIWLVSAVLLSFSAALMNAWVLLVEIKR